MLVMSMLQMGLPPIFLSLTHIARDAAWTENNIHIEVVSLLCYRLFNHCRTLSLFAWPEVRWLYQQRRASIVLSGHPHSRQFDSAFVGQHLRRNGAECIQVDRKSVV